MANSSSFMRKLGMPEMIVSIKLKYLIMKKVRIPLMIQDVKVAYDENLKKVTEGYDAKQPFFLDGPVSQKVAVIDFDPETGKVNQGIYFKKNLKGKGYCYCDAKGKNLNEYEGDELYSPEFMQASTFATILKTIELFEKDNALGHEIEWAFASKQLVVIPRAGEMANAFYNRDTNSLEFFFFPSNKKDEIIYSCLSREIVSHEAGHAIIDAIAPDLMDAYTPHSLAIHEGLADMIALFMSMSSKKLTKLILDENNGEIREQSHFTRLAEEFGEARGYKDGLRNFLNDKNLIKGKKGFVSSTGPHELSEVLSGAIYKVMEKLHDTEKKKLVKKGEFKNQDNPILSSSGKALFFAVNNTKDILFRGLDYLPPGEITFADFGRAIIVADRIKEKRRFVREWFTKEFVKRGMAETEEDLLMRKDKIQKEFKDLDIELLLDKNSYAYEFALKNKTLLFIPSSVDVFEIRKCFIAEYKYGSNKKVCVFKVAWNYLEDNPLGNSRIPQKRWVQQGTTLIIHPKEKKLLARLSNAFPYDEFSKEKGFAFERRKKEYSNAQNLRTQYLKLLIEEGTLKFGRDILDDNGVHGNTIKGALQIKGAFRSLHLCK